MFKKTYRLAFIALAIALQVSFAGLAALPSQTIDALNLISSRTGTTRLDFNSETQSWSLYDASIPAKIIRLFSPKNRFDMISPLENLASEIEESVRSANGERETFHTVRRAYSSLSALYSYYKINPNTDEVKQTEFIQRFAHVLQRLKSVLANLEPNLARADSHSPESWFDEGAGFKYLDINPSKQEPGLLQRLKSRLFGEEQQEGQIDLTVALKYLDMSEKGLRALNETLEDNGNHHTKIDRAGKFYPTEGNTEFRSSSNIKATKKLAIFVVHGTFSADAPEYTSDKNAVFQQTKYMAQSLANDQNAPVELYSFGWSGANSDEARMLAGEELANFVQTYFPTDEYHDIYVGHSHGGNVIFHLAKTMREYRTPHMIVTLATPIRKDFVTDNVNYLFQFYTPTDWVQVIGSYEVTFRNATGTGAYNQSARRVSREDMDALGLFKHNGRYNDVKIYAIHTQLNNSDLKGRLQSHTDMKHLIGALPRLLDTLIQYRANSTFVLNVDLDAKPESVNQMDSLRFQIVKTS